MVEIRREAGYGNVVPAVRQQDGGNTCVIDGIRPGGHPESLSPMGLSQVMAMPMTHTATITQSQARRPCTGERLDPVAEHYAEAFTLIPGRCFRMVR